jgi:hypothetical protein
VDIRERKKQEDGKKLHNELRNVYTSNIIITIKSQIKWARHVKHMGGMTGTLQDIY